MAYADTFIKSQETRNTEVLSQDEIDQLLAAINTDPSAQVGPVAPGHVHSSQRKYRAKNKLTDTKKVTIYDFERPRSFSQKRLDKIAEVYNIAAASPLSELFKGVVYWESIQANEITCEEFLHSVVTPLASAVIDIGGNNRAIATIDASVAHAIVYSIFCTISIFQGPETILPYMTPLELRALSIVFDTVADKLSRVLEQPCVVVSTSYGQVPPESLPCAPREMGLMLVDEVHLRSAVGVASVFTPSCVFSKKSESKRKYSGSVLDSFVDDINVALSVRATGITKTVREVKQLKVNSMLTFDSGLTIYSEHVPTFRAKLINKIKRQAYVLDILYKEELKMSKQHKLVDSIGDIDLVISAEVGRTTMKLKDLKSITEGSLIELDQIAGEPINIFANNAIVGKGEVVVSDDVMTIRVLEFASGGDILDD
jgi:flagellar motor switch protein FliN